MRRPTPIPESRISELNEFRKQKWVGYEFQRFLCIWLRVNLNMSTADIAKALSWHVNTVRFTQKNFIDNGIKALVEVQRGGRHRALMTPEEEKEFLSSFEKLSAKGGILVVNELKIALESKLGRTIHKTTMYRILSRNGWRKIAPRPSHPKKDEKAGEAFKKGASQIECQKQNQTGDQ